MIRYIVISLCIYKNRIPLTICTFSSSRIIYIYYTKLYNIGSALQTPEHTHPRGSEMEGLKQVILDFIEDHENITLATVSPDGRPMVAIVAYASEGPSLYVITGQNTNKYKNILANGNVGFASEVEGTDWTNIRSLQMQGHATAVTDPDEIDKAMTLLMNKFPQFASLPPNPDMGIIRIDITEGYHLDYSQEFGHRDRVVF